MNLLLSTLMRMVRPNRWLAEQLADIKVEDPLIDWQALANECPWREYSHMANSIRRPIEIVPGDPHFGFGTLVDESEASQSRRIDIRDIYGITASKSHIVPLKRLSETLDVDNILRTRAIRELIQEVLHGSSDCVARRGEPVDVLEQTWDGRLYVQNSGGSHRFAAIWRWHREQGMPLMMDCSVTQACISAATLAAVTEHRYWLLATAKGMKLYDLLSIAGDRTLTPSGRLRKGGIAVRSVDIWRSRLPGALSTICIAYPRAHPMAGEIDRWLENSPAVDLSAAIMHIAAGRTP